MGSASDLPSRTYPPGVPSWVDTEQPDVGAAIAFYGGLFGWTFADAMPPGAPSRYVIAQLGGRDVAAIAGPLEGDAPSWNTYVSVDDADAAVRRLESAGATVRSAPTDAGEGGRSAVLTDPEGVEFRLWQPRRRLGVQVANEPGAWNFSDLHTRDAAMATEFYQSAFEWQFDDLGFGTLIRRPGYGDHLEATVDPDIRTRQAQISAPVGFEDAIARLVVIPEDEQPRWHVLFTVVDRDRSVADAERLGATVLDTADSGWTRTALIRDPQGAQFAVSQFTPGPR